MRNCLGCEQRRKRILVALVIRFGGILQEAGVLDGDLVPDLGGGATALLVDLLGDTHCGGGTAEVAGGCGCASCEYSGGGSEGIGQGKHMLFAWMRFCVCQERVEGDGQQFHLFTNTSSLVYRPYLCLAYITP
jgi:hypothetical protein